MKIRSLILSGVFVLSTFSLSLANGHGEKDEKVTSYKKEIKNIYSNYKSFHFPTLDETYKDFVEAIEIYNEDSSESNFIEVEHLADKIKFFHKLKEEEKWHDEAISNRYFDLSAEVFQYKRRVDNLFIVERGSGSFYGGMENHTNSVIQKKRLYEAGMLAYEENLKEVKHTNHCDYAQRIEYLTENKNLLVKMETILAADDTRDFEKSLKNLEDTEKIKELIFNYQID
ncbi:hypothetical protein [Fulvivirga lutea]|uniref:DUF4919 domain-containing protein n=1 Tax=Fulvivirga lutea TaxID=2810512 RepID=A0A974ZZJ7_9BACT|nr:hypothetical protein [Fulvivirga lutea]QSE96190.1 hypothetical protein JR347_11260 [Fulvivirga lutea]